MDETAALFRIRVVVVSTRAAVRSLIPGDGEQLAEVVGRARDLLNHIEADLDSTGSETARARLGEARHEIERFERGARVPGE